MSRDGPHDGGDVELTSVATLDAEHDAQANGNLVLEPDGLHDEHRPLRSEQDSSAEYKATYTSLDPSRLLPLYRGKGKWLILVAVGTLLIAFAGSLLALVPGVSSQELFSELGSGLCQDSGTYPYPTTVLPVSYTLSLVVSEANFLANETLADESFGANSSMAFSALETFSSLIVYSSGLNYTSVRLSTADQFEIQICSDEGSCKNVVSVIRPEEGCPATGLVEIKLGRDALQGRNYSLSFSYKGAFSPSQGLYRSASFKYDDMGVEKESVLLVTQLEQFGARHLLPCLDEPDKKAVFTVDLTYPVGMTALSNTQAYPLVQQADNYRERKFFERTPVMSPYLLAVCIGKLTSKSKLSGSGLDVTVWSVPKLEQQLTLPLQLSAAALDFYTNWTGVPQPLKKFDLAAVPGKGGAMENWGLLLFDEDRFLWNNMTEGSYGKWLSADVICHEVAHQWFGNLATTRDWSHLTVNEGVASFMEYLCLQAVLPNSSAHLIFQRATSPMGESIGSHEGPRRTALLADLEPYTSALVPANDSRLVPAGEITYSKGAALLAMLSDLLESAAPGSFQEGLRRYLTRHAYGAATVDDLLNDILESFQQAKAWMGGRDALQEDLLRWFYQPGVPLVTLTATKPPGIEQARFLEWGGESLPTAAPWCVPFSLQSIAGPAVAATNVSWMILDGTTRELTVDMGDTGNWTLNAKGSGLFRAAYPSDHIATLAKAISTMPADTGVDNILAVAALLEDMPALLVAGKAKPADMFLLFNATASSPAFAVAHNFYPLGGTLLDQMRQLRQLLVLDSDCLAGLDAFVSKMTGGVVEGVLASAGGASFTNASQEADLPQSMAQADILRDAALAGNAKAAGFLCSRFTNTTAESDPSSPAFVSPDLRGAVYIAAVAQPSGCSLSEDATVVWERMRSCWQEDEDITQSRRCLFALAYTRQQAAIQMTLDLLLDPKGASATLLAKGKQVKTVADKDVVGLLRILSRSQEGAERIWAAMHAALQSANSDTAKSSLWSRLNQIPLPPSREVQRELEQLLQDDEVGSTLVASAQTQGRLANNLQLLQERKPQICSSFLRDGQ